MKKRKTKKESRMAEIKSLTSESELVVSLTPPVIKFLSATLMYRLIPTTLIPPEYEKQTIHHNKQDVTVYLHRSLQGFFEDDPSYYIRCCENIDTAISCHKKEHHAIAIDLHLKLLAHEAVMPVYSAITADEHVYCLIATKLVIECMKSALCINKLLRCMWINQTNQ